MAEEPTEEELFFIAADLTLYSNPLNRALGQASLTKDIKKEVVKEKEPEKLEEVLPDDEFIASDMNKYDSPLAELDTMYNEKHDVRQQAQETHLQHDDDKEVET